MLTAKRSVSKKLIFMKWYFRSYEILTVHLEYEDLDKVMTFTGNGLNFSQISVNSLISFFFLIEKVLLLPFYTTNGWNLSW